MLNIGQLMQDEASRTVPMKDVGQMESNLASRTVGMNDMQEEDKMEVHRDS